MLKHIRMNFCPNWPLESLSPLHWWPWNWAHMPHTCALRAPKACWALNADKKLRKLRETKGQKGQNPAKLATTQNLGNTLSWPTTIAFCVSSCIDHSTTMTSGNKHSWHAHAFFCEVGLCRLNCAALRMLQAERGYGTVIIESPTFSKRFQRFTDSKIQQ